MYTDTAPMGGEGKGGEEGGTRMGWGRGEIDVERLEHVK